ncbi:pyridoxamine 5'-phosphate oxidase family protein [Desulfovermiculus halophilus]|jgi:nitroimidazol reductase NimA-like FMN-containing flavoprotein (pyridoxamine 5'-phosphate oxidase superfamily)|uniref:pyridoxamine 5'-phosphate oxidase family protein n=1 Tax=Desulfovermiculus halophilus TaxID=339722 RepID=UPI0004815A91|nr:pyridoxamine 5'-phosphate oxidase family protein [Desulfovermiculus halophilus]
MSFHQLPLEPQKTVLAREDKESFLHWVHAFLAARQTLILATCWQAVPACNLMSFAPAPGVCSLVIVSPADSRKSRALRHNPNVSLLALDDKAYSQDLDQGTALTMNGRAREVAAGERQGLEQVFTARNPSLEPFARSPQSAVFCIRVHHLVAVTNFQKLTELHLEE